MVAVLQCTPGYVPVYYVKMGWLFSSQPITDSARTYFSDIYETLDKVQNFPLSRTWGISYREVHTYCIIGYRNMPRSKYYYEI
jgi:hypothetical protein